MQRSGGSDGTHYLQCSGGDGVLGPDRTSSVGRQPQERARVPQQRGRALEKVLVPLAEDVNRASVRGIPERTVATVRKTLLQMIQNLVDEEAGTGEPDPAVK